MAMRRDLNRAPFGMAIAAVIAACLVASVLGDYMKHRWAFPDPRNRAVFTTKGLLQARKPILRVFHDRDADWQFLGEEEVCDTNGSVVGLGTVVDYDPSLAELARMPTGYCAYRGSTSDKWIMQRMEPTVDH